MILLFASRNSNKKREIQKVLPDHFQLKDLSDLNLTEDIEETGSTLEENAFIKVRYLHSKFNLDCIAEDSGLEIEGLHGEPGVYSARYAGPEKNDKKNIELVLQKMKGMQNRKARFRTAIALILNNQEYLFEGIIDGEIAFSARGNHGFGYDPIFIPDHFQNTFGELGEVVKVKISHRTLAVNKLIDFLKNQK
jgi:XTP/dITP diphosphohydrolase